MFREEEFDDDQYDEGEEEYSEEFTNERLYPNLSDSRSDDFPNSLNPMMNGSITQLNDLGFKPILSESMMVNEKVKVQSSPPPIVNDITLKMNNDRCDGEILSGQSTPREMISCKLSDMEIDLKKYPDFIPTHYDLYEDKIFEEMDHRRLSNASSNKDEDYFSNYSKIDWDVNEDEEQIELIYCEEPRRKKKVPNNQFSEFDLGVASCRETLKEWEIEERNNLTLLNNLADFHILNKIISFIYYPNKEDLLRISQTQEKNYDIAQMLKKIISLRLVNKKWKQSIDNPTGVLYHYLIEYATMEKSIALNNLKVEESKFCLFSVPGIAMVGLANILKDASLLPMTFGNLAYEKVEGQYGSTAANTVKVLGAGISLASGTFALFALSGVFYWIPAAAGGFVLDKAIEYGINYSNKVKAENEVIHNVGEKEKKLLQFRKKIRRVTKFDKIEIVDHEKVEQVQQYQDSSLSGYLFSYGGYFQNKHSVYYVMRVSLKFDENNQSQSQTFSYRIKKRYSQFQKLYQQMCSLRKVDKIMYNDEYLAFPEKERLDTILNWRSDEIIGMRTKIFNNILSELVENIEVYKNDEEIMLFLTDSCE